MALISITNPTILNSETSDVTKLTANDNDLKNGLTDGTKDIKVNVATIATLTGTTITASTVTLAAGAITSGTYTPTLTVISNITGTPTVNTCHYLRIGNQVQVTGSIQVDPTAAAETQFYLTLPIASNLTANWDVAGLAACGTASSGGYGVVYADTTGDRAYFDYISITTAIDYLAFSFTYTVK